MKSLNSLLVIGILALAPFSNSIVYAAEKQAYMIDELPMVFRTGPTTGYRMQSGLNTGDAVEILAVDEENNTTQIKTAQGKIGWVDSKYLVTTEGAKSQLNKVTKQLKALQKKYQQAAQDDEDLLNQQTAISERNFELQRQVTELTNTLQIEQQKNLRLTDKKQYDIFYAGGGVAFVGLILGWFLARRRPKKSGWN